MHTLAGFSHIALTVRDIRSSRTFYVDVLGMSVLENFGLPNLPQFSAAGFIQRKQERNAFALYVNQLRIRIPNDRQLARNLSGGNQQKVVLAKWLQSHSEVIIFDEPTRGIDVGAKAEIYAILRGLAGEGVAVLLISSEVPELINNAARVLILRDGQISGELSGVMSEEAVLARAMA